MNREAARHVDKAVGYIERGEGFYRKAAEEIVAAQKADPTLSNREIGEHFERSATWVRDLVRWITTSQSTAPTPYSGQADAVNLRKTKQMLREAPMEQVEQIVSSLPKSRQLAIAAAAGDRYATARQEHDEREARLTPAERREREQAGERLTRPVRQAAAGFTTLGISGHLEQAAEELNELNADASLTPKAMKPITRAHEAWVAAYEFAMQLVGDER